MELPRATENGFGPMFSKRFRCRRTEKPSACLKEIEKKHQERVNSEKNKAKQSLTRKK